MRLLILSNPRLFLVSHLLILLHGCSAAPLQAQLVSLPRSNHDALVPLESVLALKSEADHLSRHLVSYGKETLCSAEIKNTLGATACLSTGVSWDVDDILRADHYYGVANSDLFSLYVGYYQGQICKSFDICVSLNDFVVLFGQYTYDCSNVYCGPNAKVDCNGNSETSSTCPAGTDEALLADIPTMAQANCERRYRALTAVDAVPAGRTCGVCVDDAIVCEPYCDSCNPDGQCLMATESYWFTQTQNIIQLCFENNNSSFCLASFGPPGIGQYGDISQFSCGAELHGIPCECSICGVKKNSAGQGLYYFHHEVYYEASCSNNTAVMSMCNNNSLTGELEFLAVDLYPLSCDGTDDGSTTGGGADSTTGATSGGPGTAPSPTSTTATGSPPTTTESGITTNPGNDSSSDAGILRCNAFVHSVVVPAFLFAVALVLAVQ